MSTTPAEPAGDPPRSARPAIHEDMGRFALLIAAGWLLTNLGLAISNLPLKFLLKDQLGLTPERVAAFLAIGQFTNYVKPIAGILTDSVPLFGTRRRHYLLLSLFATGVLWIVLSLVPRQWGWMLLTYTVMYSMVVVTSSTLGGVMVEAANRFGAAGRMTAQRIATFKIGSILGDLSGGWLAEHFPFIVPSTLCAAMHFALIPLFGGTLNETPSSKVNRQAWRDAAAQLAGLRRCPTLFWAAGMVFLIAAAPGFNTPLLFYQRDQLHFSKSFIGFLLMVNAAAGLLGAVFYYAACRRLPLGSLTAASIGLHALGSLTYFYYRDWETALVVTCINGMTSALAMLPVYDLAARATPRGSEALGYALMMSVWNFTNALSDWSGALVFTGFGQRWSVLVWVNAVTTLIALGAVPFLPKELLLRKDG